jgi:limonene-1,2-epoxide hydrolase
MGNASLAKARWPKLLAAAGLGLGVGGAMLLWRLPTRAFAEDAKDAKTAPAETGAAAEATPEGEAAAPGGEGEGEGASETPSLPEDAAEAPSPSSMIVDFYDGFGKETIKQKVEIFYGPKVVYEDPFAHVEGRDRLLTHYQALFAGVKSVNVEVREEFVSGEETVALWTMTLSHKKLKDGTPIVVDGVTHIKVEGGKVVYQRDYYDAATLYESLSFVGRSVRWVRESVLSE